MKAFTVNIAVNTKLAPIRRSGPIYPNGSFEYVPIPSSNGLVNYIDLGLENTFCRMGIPSKVETRVHHDPEFVGFTYGTYPEEWGNVGNLKSVEEGDLIIFFGSLEMTAHETLGNRFPDWIFNPRGMYLMGMFELEGILTREGESFETKLGRKKYNTNPHFTRLEKDSTDTSWIFKGSNQSTLFPVAIPMGREQFELMFDQSLPKKTSQNETAQVSSYMRSAREVTNVPYLINLISKFNPSVWL